MQDGWMVRSPTMLGSHFASIKTATLEKRLLPEQAGEREFKSGGPRPRLGGRPGHKQGHCELSGGKRCRVTGFSWWRESRWDSLEAFPTRLSTAVLYCCFFSSKYKGGCGGPLFAGGARGSSPPGPRRPLCRLRPPPPLALCLAPALPRTWSPVKLRAAPGDTCREAGS